jgi:hypothetical protein
LNQPKFLAEAVWLIILQILAIESTSLLKPTVHA